MRQGSERIDGVDLLRGLAIFFVLMNHVNLRLLIAKIPYTNGLPDQLVSSLACNGQNGVQIFFAVSGFLITATTILRWGSLGNVSPRGFYLMRFARIMPLFLLLLAVLSGLHFAKAQNFVVRENTGGLGRALLAALTFHVNVLEARRGYLPANWDILWSLSVEEVFYVFFPAVVRLLGRGRLLIVFLLALVAIGPLARTILAHGSEIWKEYSYFGGMDAIALGCLTAILLSHAQLSPAVIRVCGSVGIAAVIFILGFSITVERLRLTRLGLDMTILAVGTCMVIAVAAQTKWKAPRLLSSIVKLGQRSYEVYLTHMFVVFALFAIFVRAGSSLAAVPLLFIAVVAVSGLLGEAVARFYSEPMNALIRQRWGSAAARKVSQQLANPQ